MIVGCLVPKFVTLRLHPSMYAIIEVFFGKASFQLPKCAIFGLQPWKKCCQLQSMRPWMANAQSVRSCGLHFLSPYVTIEASWYLVEVLGLEQ